TLASRRAHYAAEEPAVWRAEPLSRMAVETLAFILHNLPAIGERTLEHISIVGVAVGIAILTGVPIGIAITQSQRIADTVLYIGSIVITIPSIALFGRSGEGRVGEEGRSR